jgi:tetratricopeptide (TPR) repeat protein
VRAVKASTLLMSLLLCLSARATATPETSTPDPQVQINTYYDDLFARRFAAALSDIKDLDSSNAQGQATLVAMRAAALLGMNREAEAEPLIAQIEQLSPKDATARSFLFQGALLSGHVDVAADSIDLLIARFPDAARDLDWNLVRNFLERQPKDQDRRNRDRLVALARIGYGGATEVGRGRARDAAYVLADRGDFKGAAEFLPQVDDVRMFESWLIQKRYSVLWPKLEEVGGKHLANVRAEALATAERDYRAAPDDMEKLQAYAAALRHSGRINDAIALKSKLPATPEGFAKADESTGWVVDEIASALNDAGRGDEGDQLYAMLNTSKRTDAGWRVSMIINRLNRLVAAGKLQEATTLLEATDEATKSESSAYGRQLFRQLDYCVLTRTGKADEAAKVLTDMLAHSKDAFQPTLDGLLCAGDVANAEKLSLQALDSSDKAQREGFEKDFVWAMQPVPLTGDVPTVWASAWKELRRHSAIAAVYAKLGRDLPADLLPDKATNIAPR